MVRARCDDKLSVLIKQDQLAVGKQQLSLGQQPTMAEGHLPGLGVDGREEHRAIAAA